MVVVVVVAAVVVVVAAVNRCGPEIGWRNALVEKGPVLMLFQVYLIQGRKNPELCVCFARFGHTHAYYYMRSHCNAGHPG